MSRNVASPFNAHALPPDGDITLRIWHLEDEETAG